MSSEILIPIKLFENVEATYESKVCKIKEVVRKWFCYETRKRVVEMQRRFCVCLCVCTYYKTEREREREREKELEAELCILPT